jgi:hypothetical protein
MQEIKELKITYYAHLGFAILFNILIIVGIVLSVVPKENSLFSASPRIVPYVVFAALIIMEAYLLYSLIIGLRDLKSVRTSSFERVTGKVIRYMRNQSETGSQLNNFPIIQIENSDETIRLLVNKGTAINETYTFIYLKHTKLGVATNVATIDECSTNEDDLV